MIESAKPCLANLLSRSFQQDGATLIRVSLQNRQDKREALEVFQCEDLGERGLLQWLPPKDVFLRPTENTHPHCCVARMWVNEPNRAADYGAPGPALCQFLKHRDSIHAVIKSAYEAPLCLLEIRCQQIGEEVETSDIVCE
jgi:hypothetical protein